MPSSLRRETASVAVLAKHGSIASSIGSARETPTRLLIVRPIASDHAILLTPFTNDVAALQGKPIRVHLGVTGSATGIAAMPFQVLADAICEIEAVFKSR